MCEITESESLERRLDSLAAEVDRLRGANATLRFEAERLRSEVADRFRAERDAALLGLGRVLSGADAAVPPAGDLVAFARGYLGLDAATAGEKGDDRENPPQVAGIHPGR